MKWCKQLMICLWAGLASQTLLAETNQPPVWDQLTDLEKKIVDQILTHWESWIPAKKLDGTAPLITFEELYKGLSKDQVNMLERIKHIDPKESFDFQGDYLGESNAGVTFIRLDRQQVMKKKSPEFLEPQYLPNDVYEAYQKMMGAMKQDLGTMLLVESGYRSPAYQLYTFVFYCPKHHYSLKETGKWIALPGYSEHGAPHRQAIDFINRDGVNGEDDVTAFERLPEYHWLLQHAQAFGFELSYPRGKAGITFEPWHWRWTKAQ